MEGSNELRLCFSDLKKILEVGLKDKLLKDDNFEVKAFRYETGGNYVISVGPLEKK